MLNLDIATLIGAIAGFSLLLVTMMVSGSLLMYWDFLSLVIVVGGAMLSVLMRFPLRVFIKGMLTGMEVISSSTEEPEELIETLVDLANKARKESILALEKETFANEFLAKGIKMCVDGAEPRLIEEIMTDDIIILKKRMSNAKSVFQELGDATPAFGMIGTVIGLIVIMANLSDPSKIGPGLAVALVTTLYGAAAANIIFIPIAKKLKFLGGEEVRNFKIIKTGVISILEGHNPQIIRDRLNTHLL